MAKEPVEPTEEEATDPGKRLDELEARQEGLSDKIDQILGILGGKKPEGDPAPDAQPSSIADEIRQQLEAKTRRDADDAEKRGHADELAAIKARVAELAEKPPQEPVRRSTRLMWGNP
jgi:hypothetical protein